MVCSKAEGRRKGWRQHASAGQIYLQYKQYTSRLSSLSVGLPPPAAARKAITRALCKCKSGLSRTRQLRQSQTAAAQACDGGSG